MNHVEITKVSPVTSPVNKDVSPVVLEASPNGVEEEIVEILTSPPDSQINILTPTGETIEQVGS